MYSVQKGKYIVSAAKSLKRYRLADETIATFLYATSYAGRVGLFLSALRHNKNISLVRPIADPSTVIKVLVAERRLEETRRIGNAVLFRLKK